MVYGVFRGDQREKECIRNFQKKNIPKEIVDKLINSLIWALSAWNLQSRKVFFIRDAKLKEDIASAALNQDFIAESPLVIVGCADSRIANRYGERGEYLYSIQDVAVSIMGMMLVAHENGLGMVWVSAFMEEEVFDILKLPGNLRPVTIVPVGHPVKIPLPHRGRQENRLWSLDEEKRIVFDRARQDEQDSLFFNLHTKDTKMAKCHSFLFACFVGNMLLLHFMLVW